MLATVLCRTNCRFRERSPKFILCTRWNGLGQPGEDKPQQQWNPGWSWARVRLSAVEAARDKVRSAMGAACRARQRGPDPGRSRPSCCVGCCVHSVCAGQVLGGAGRMGWVFR